MLHRWYWKVLAVATPRGRRINEMSRKLIWNGMLNGTMPERAAATAEYQRHVDDVIASVPADRLLVFTANQG